MGYDRHFVTGNFTPHPKFLSDEDYVKVLDSIVVTCADCILINRRGEMLLGKRRVEPQPDWWIIGGRMRVGESFQEATARNIKRELGLDIKPKRFQYLGAYSLVWATRAQKPQDGGCHMVSITMTLRVKDSEIAAIKHNEEYEKLQWMKPKDVLADANFHPTVRRYAFDLMHYFENYSRIKRYLRRTVEYFTSHPNK